MKKEKSILRQAIRGIFIFILVFLIIIGVRIIIAANSHESALGIEFDKKAAYTIYNEGLESYGYSYDEVTITSPEREDREIVFNNGLKYVTYPDLLQIEMIDQFDNTIKYDGKNIKCYDDFLFQFKCKYVEILIDREHIKDITYYQYKEVIDYRTIIISTIKFILYCVIVVAFIFVLLVIQEKINCEDDDFEEEDTQENTYDEHEEDENAVEEDKEE